jgi:hypothetical protein
MPDKNLNPNSYPALDSNSDSDNYNIVKKIKQGYSGQVFLIENNKTNRRYALKRQKVYPTDYQKPDLDHINNPIWFELLFFKFVKRLEKSDKKFFMKKYYHKFYDNCTFKWTKPDYMPETKITKILKASSWCLDIITDLKDGDSADLIKQNILSDSARGLVYSFIIQVLYIFLLLHTNNYRHYDNNAGNICFVRTNKKYIRLNKLDMRVKSFGYQFSLIDYESSLHKTYDLSNRDKQIYSDNLLYNMDLNIFIQKVLLRLDDDLLDGLAKSDKLDSANSSDLNTKTIFRTNSHTAFDKLAKFVYEHDPAQYKIIKNDILTNYSQLDKSDLSDLLARFDNFELSNKFSSIRSTVSRVFRLENEISQYMGIYNKRLLCKILDIPYTPNLLDKSDLLYIKKHYSNMVDIIRYFMDKI